MRATTRSGGDLLGVWFLAAVTLAAPAIGCGSSSALPADGGGGSSGHGAMGGLGGQAATGGQVDGGSDHLDAASGFMPFAPCAAESDYVSNMTAIAFGGSLGLAYSPACLKVAPGTTITFSGDFSTHPLMPSTSRTAPGPTPIVMTDSGTTKSFTFGGPGFYGYYCLQHGDDDGDAMSGVIWAQ